MRVEQNEQGFALYKEKTAIGWLRAAHRADGADYAAVWVDEAWRGRGYGSYLVKEALRCGGGFDRQRPSCFTAPPPAGPAEAALWAKFGFLAEGGRLVRRYAPDLTAVRLAQQFVAAHCPAPALAIDATCGNGGDTAFLWGLAAGCGGRLLAMDVQPAAIRATGQRLARAGADMARCRLVCGSHASLLQYAAPASADIVMFNFGWLPGADHSVHSQPGSSLAALDAALQALRPGGVLSAVLYSGKVVGWAEREQVLAWLRALPLGQYTALACDFANWGQTAPQPCFVLKK